MNAATQEIAGMLEDCRAEIAETIDYLSGLQAEAAKYETVIASLSGANQEEGKEYEQS